MRSAEARPGLAGPAEAERFVAELLATMQDLAAVLAEETGHLAAGRLRAGLGLGARKGELAGTYLRGVEAAKASAVALARYAPGKIAALKQAQAALQQVALRNQDVIATSRAISEGLVRSLAQETALRQRPRSYGPAASSPARGGAMPLVYSGRL